MRIADIIPVEVDHSAIPAGDLEIATANAMLDPDGQIFPWLDGHPRVGSVVYYDGGLWTAVDRESGPGSESPLAYTILIPAYVAGPIDDTRGPMRAELRPVTWTQGQELESQRGVETMRVDSPQSTI